MMIFHFFDHVKVKDKGRIQALELFRQRPMTWPNFFKPRANIALLLGKLMIKKTGAHK
jgi:hypothetical protein